MSNDNKVLSQEEIDAMLAGGSDDGDDEGEASSTPPVSESEPEPVVEEPEPEPQPARVAVAEQPVPVPEPTPTPTPMPVPVAPPPVPPPAPAPPPAPPPAPVFAPEPVAVPEPVLPPQPVPIMATVDAEALNALAARIERLEAALAESNNSIMQIHQEYQTFSTQVQLMGSRLEGVLDNLKSTLGYRAQKTFTCASCEADGNVAAKVKCTSCGKENWWGWWPESQ